MSVSDFCLHKTLVNLTGQPIYMRLGDQGAERVQIIAQGKLVLETNDEIKQARSETMLVQQSDGTYLRARSYVTAGPTDIGSFMIIPPGGKGQWVPFEPVDNFEYIVSNEFILELLFAKQTEEATKFLPIMSFLVPLHDVKDMGAASANALTFFRRFEI